MSCQATSFAKAASPVGAPLISGNPNTWNIGAGNHYSHLTNPFLPDPEPTSSATRQFGGKRKKTRKHKKSKRHNIKRGKSKRRKNNRRKSKRRKPKTNKRMRHKRRVTRRRRGGLDTPDFLQRSTAENLKIAANCDDPNKSTIQKMQCKAAAHGVGAAVATGKTGLKMAYKIGKPAAKLAGEHVYRANTTEEQRAQITKGIGTAQKKLSSAYTAASSNVSPDIKAKASNMLGSVKGSLGF